MEKSFEIDRLRNDLEIVDVESKRSQEILKSKLETSSAEHQTVCEELDKLQMELNFLKREREESAIRSKELDMASELSNDLRDLKDQLLTITNERDKMMTEIEQHNKHLAKVEIMKKSYDDRLFKAKVEVEELAGELSSKKLKMHNDEVKNSLEKAKLRMRVRWTQAKLDAYRIRHKEAADELDFMNKKYEAASTKLKDRLASYGIEILTLKKQLATASKPQ